jgi:hypothetical protein
VSTDSTGLCLLLFLIKINLGIILGNYIILFEKIMTINLIKKIKVQTNMESINALLIRQQLLQSERLVQLNAVAITQMKSLTDNRNLMNRLK